MRVLISGAGIAGPTLSYWLSRYGIETTIAEKASHLRTGGYVIDFWGAGFEVADRMGLTAEIRAKGYQVDEVRVVDRNGNRKAGFPVRAFREAMYGRFTSIARGDLATAIFEKLDDRVEVIFSESIASIEQTESKVQVKLQSGQARDFDLVVGADGLHSRVRELVFGGESSFERYLGYRAAAFEVSGYQPREELAYILHTEVNRQVARFSMRDDRTMFLLTFADESPISARDISEQKALVRDHFKNSGWECPAILEAMETCQEFYFDRVSQIRMGAYPPLWTRGRVILLGDAAFCVSLLAGEGSSLAMAAAYILAGELQRADGDYALAFKRYQDVFGPFLLGKQKAALRMAGTFAPKTRLALGMRNQLFQMLGVPWIAKIAARWELTDKITLPDYSRH